MKLVTYNKEGSISCGILVDRGIIDIPSGWKELNPPRSVKQILKADPPCLDQLRKLAETADSFISLDSVQLLAPIPRPGKALALAGNYPAHIKEVGLTLGLSDSPRYTTVPRPFIIPSTAITGAGAEIPWPLYSEQVDYEIELAIVIGKEAKCVPAEEALDYVAGYTIANDISARSVTFSAGRKKRPWDEFYDWLSGKWSDGFLPMGPYLLTADEVDDVQNLAMTLKVNDNIRQDANTNQMVYPVADIISFLSHIMTLEPGDIIATGTPAGVAMATGHWLEPGDKIECTIDKLGTLINTVGQKPQEFYKSLK